MLTETQRRPAESQETQSENTLLVAMKQFPVTDLYLNFAERYFFLFHLFLFSTVGTLGKLRQTLWLLVECEQRRLSKPRAPVRFSEILLPFGVEVL